MKLEFSQNMNVAALHTAYASGQLSPKKLMENIRQRAKEFEKHNIWIHLLTADEQAKYLLDLEKKDFDTAPLWGVPFAIKDNIDLAGIPTTAACKEFSYVPKSHAKVVQQLIDAGAIPVGKTNLDQFATGLNGTRSPWGACKNAFDPDFISGGSSSGSAVAVALGLATFSLGTDTAGSGRVPACFNNLIGVKPSRGLLSATGLVPACRSLDCMTIFSYTADDANLILSVAEGYDEQDAYSSENPFQNQYRQYGDDVGDLKIGIVPESQLKFFGDESYAKAYQETLNDLRKLGFEMIEFDYAPFDEAAKLLYEGPWVAERYIATLPLIEENPEAMFPVVREIISGGARPKATELFSAQYRLNALKKICDREITKFDCLLTPTAGRCFTIEEMLDEPILYNSQLGYYTNYMNLLDLSSVAVPTQMTDKDLPFGITLVGPKFHDRRLLSIAKRVHKNSQLTLGASTMPVDYSLNESASSIKNTIDVLVCGAHLEGYPLNWQLQERGAKLKKVTQTAPVYKMYALAGGPPYRPGLMLDQVAGAAIDVEIWSVPYDQFGSFVAGIPSPLGIGKVQIADETWVCGFICEQHGIAGAEDITHLGSWAAYMERVKSA